jgi:hypothetical protein
VRLTGHESALAPEMVNVLVDRPLVKASASAYRAEAARAEPSPSQAKVPNFVPTTQLESGSKKQVSNGGPLILLGFLWLPEQDSNLRPFD